MSSISPTDPLVKRLKWRRRFGRAAFVLALTATLIAGWYAIERVRGRASWERYEAAAQAAGVKLNLTEYLPPSVSDAENFASIPLFQEAFQAQAEGRQAPSRLEWPRTAGKRPPLANAVTRQNTDLPGWQRYFVDTKMIPAAESSPARDVLAALKKFDPELAQLRAAGQRSGCRFPVQWDNGFAAAMPHLNALSASTQIFTLQTAAHLAAGESGSAADNIGDMRRIYSATRREPTLIAALVRQMIPVALANLTWEGLSQRQWQQADLARIERDLRTINALADYQLGMESERALFNLFYPQLRSMSVNKVGEIFSMGQPSSSERAIASMRGRLFSLFPLGWVYRNQERSNRYFDDLLGRVAVNPPRVFSERPITHSPETLQGGYERWRLFLFALAAPAFQPMETRFANTQVLTDEARLGCALERFRLVRGKFPAQLSELTPEFMAILPADVMNGEPYHYRLTEDGGYLLYSVASNLQDDEGQTGAKTGAANQLDWVWKMPGTTGAK